jgi:hypothetical protein
MLAEYLTLYPEVVVDVTPDDRGRGRFRSCLIAWRLHHLRAIPGEWRR